MNVPYQFAGNEEMYKLAVNLYLKDLVSRVTHDPSTSLAEEIGNDVIEMIAERINAGNSK